MCLRWDVFETAECEVGQLLPTCVCSGNGEQMTGLGTDGGNILLSDKIPKLDLQIPYITFIQTLEGFEVFLVG